jgi:hypothetical protein
VLEVFACSRLFCMRRPGPTRGEESASELELASTPLRISGGGLFLTAFTVGHFFIPTIFAALSLT